MKSIVYVIFGIVCIISSVMAYKDNMEWHAVYGWLLFGFGFLLYSFVYYKEKNSSGKKAYVEKIKYFIGLLMFAATVILIINIVHSF